jgi:hypothetical protein
MTHLDTKMKMPTLARDVDQALRDVAEFGVARIESVLAGATLTRVRDALYRAAASDQERGWNNRFIGDNPENRTNRRVWCLLSRDPVFSDLAEHPVIGAKPRDVMHLSLEAARRNTMSLWSWQPRPPPPACRVASSKPRWRRCAARSPR